MGLTSFADIYIDFEENEANTEHYERGLDLHTALTYVRYDTGISQQSFGGCLR